MKIVFEKYSKHFLSFVKCILVSFALLKISGLSTGNIFSFAFFGLGYFLIRVKHRLYNSPHNSYSDSVSASFEKSNKGGLYSRANITSIALGILFSLLYSLARYNYILEGFENFLFQSIVLSLTIIGLSILFYYILMLTYFTAYLYGCKLFARHTYVNQCPLQPNGNTQPDGNTHHTSSLSAGIKSSYDKFPGAFCFVLCMLCYLPFFLYEYPGILTPDSVYQVHQAINSLPLTNEHPVVHTMLIKLCVNTGLLIFNDINKAIGVYTLVQMVLMSLGFGYCIDTLKFHKVRNHVLELISLIFALVPYNAIISVTMWKDALFGTICLVFTCLLSRIIVTEKEKIKVKTLIAFSLTGVLMCLMRSNGWFGFLATFPFLLWYFRKNIKRMYPSILAILIIAAIVKYPVMNALDIRQSDTVESLCIPIQQVARVLVKDRELAPEDLELIENVVDLTYIHELYEETFADNMKELIRAGHPEYLDEHKSDFLKLYIRLGLQYPKDYLDAYIRQTEGYWFPDKFYEIGNAEGVCSNTLGIEPNPLIRGSIIVKIREIDLKLNSIIPLYGLIWSMGSIFWIILVCLGFVIIKKDRINWILFVPVLAMTGTILIATPVCADFRYVYFNMITYPVLLLCALDKSNG